MRRKICVVCNREYKDLSLVTCIADGTRLTDPNPLVPAVLSHIPPAPGEPANFCMTCHQVFAADIEACPYDGTVLISTQSLDRFKPELPVTDAYETLSFLGRGNTSLVYLARTAGTTDDPVAMKVLSPETDTPAQAIRMTKRFKQEEDSSRHLSHPNIASFFASGSTSDGRPYQIYEYVPGPSLDLIISRGLSRFPVDYFVGIFSQICDGLQHAHERGVFHRDLKPNDVLFAETSAGEIHVKIIDFGKGSPLMHGDNRLEQLTERGDIFGDPRYLAPETCWKADLDARSNIYSLGAIMYEAIVGCPPFGGANWFITITSKQSAPPSFSSHFPDVPGISELEEIIFKSLAPEPGNRYQTMNELKVDLLEFHKRHGQLALPSLKLRELID